MYTPAAKRRRLDSANETLRKPFKSPAVKRDDAPTAEDGTATSPRHAVKTDSPLTQPGGSATGTTARRNETHMTPAKQQQQHQFKTPSRHHRPFSLSRPQHGVSASSPHATPLAKKSTSAGDVVTPVGIRSAREAEGREEIIRQAERIRARSGAEELEGLVGKWRAASRLAAEEVFEASRERVRGMGGMKGWGRARREEQRCFAERMREEEPGRDGGEDSTGRVGAESDGDEDGGGGDDDDDDEGEEHEEEFTMGTMLRSMNIDFDVIGYDEDTGWWRDG
ncbi:hypothetical protein CkaCkLH20_06783 [Colletotrichum karsti]|uniref:Swi5-dependent recombination DNA repair protein 1 n=1 Tax=Colletotrichum karsti TaxID=1095194 RepID=A0A9P6LK59_9PEZI|nr:uncharacterized protein CkaCkLH20_06783 [Colletotrichum karsti]KAF9875851.1 hypothetical protein CkaCkLH20_06783 [Colletotrichum karsti]